MKVSRVVRRMLVSVLFIASIMGSVGLSPRHASADTNQEWAAVQRVVGNTIDPQAFLSPVMDATGSQAIQDGAILQIPPGQFVTYQEHPAWMMAAVQRMIRRFDVGSYGVMTVESVNEQAGIFNTTGLDAVEQADLIQRLRAQPLATSYLAPAKPATTTPMYRPINPLTARFRLPDALAGELAPSLREGTGCEAPCMPLADYAPGPPAVFTFQVGPPLKTKALVNGIYWVGVFKTVDAARAVNLKVRDTTRTGDYAAGDPSWLVDPASGRLSIAQPVADNEWLRGYHSRVNPQNGWRDCYAVAGVRYNNIVMLAQVDNYNSVTPPGYVTCQTSYKWSTRVLAVLYTRAQSYARHQ